MRLIRALESLERHPVLQKLTLNDVVQYARIIGHLKNDILLPQPLEQSDPNVPPDVFPLSLVEFLSLALKIEKMFIQDSWDILKYYVWECATVPLIYEDFELFREFGWPRGIAALSIYPHETVCTTVGCGNTRPLKKETSREVVIYTAPNGVQAAWAIHLYCPECNTDYHNNFTVHNGEHTYYKDVPLYVQVGEHQFVEQKVIRAWINNMLIAWVSASNAAKAYEMSLGYGYLKGLKGTGWQFGSRLTTEHVWDAFITLCLIEDKQRRNQRLQVPHSGMQKDRFREAMAERNQDFVLNGQPGVVDHACDKCYRTYMTASGDTRHCHPIVGDGLSIGRPCCAVFACREPLQNNRHRYCKTHFNQHDVCVIIKCEEPITGLDSKTCSIPEHKAFERKNKEKGASNFILKERFRYTQASQPVDTLATQQIDHVDDVEETTIEWFEVDDNTNTVRLKSRANPGTVGTEDDAALPPLDPCPSKSATGNRVVKAQFSRKRTHNEQTLVRPCGIIYARATMFGAEAVSNFLVMVQNAFSIPGAKKPEHIFYDTNCLARQQAEKSFPWFKGIGMCVDVWHFLNKHQTTHQYCQENCNPIQFPELLDEFGKWFFNTSVAEQINAWLQGYHSIVREMLPDKFDFFLDEMIMRRNVEHLKKLEEQGHNPRSLDD